MSNREKSLREDINRYNKTLENYSELGLNASNSSLYEKVENEYIERVEELMELMEDNK